ncbi:hypothetical protein [Gemmata sp.]|uniref:hypothetical protein n=1 Tax=Gemmata sp. TaxID=1914242 RepID=UPI003F730A34
MPPPDAPHPSGRARLQNDPDKFIRPVKGNKFQARPCDLGVRYNLGVFPTIGEARRAVAEFWWGKREPRVRFARPVRDRAGRVTWIACVRVPGVGGGKLETVRVGGTYPSAKDAHAAAVAWLVAELGVFAWRVVAGCEVDVRR